jgi:hypothetical protein
MSFRVVWTLMARSERELDAGCIDEVFADYGAAIAAVSSLLRNYAEAGRSDDGRYWWARHSPDADLEFRVRVECHETCQLSGS